MRDTDAHARTRPPARWHRTGDVGHLDERGRLWVEGRMPHVHRHRRTGRSPRWGPSRKSKRVARACAAPPSSASGPHGLRQAVAVVETVPPTARARPRRSAPHPCRAREHRHPAGRRARRPAAAHRHPAQLEDRPVATVRLGRARPRRRKARRPVIVLVTGASGFLGRAVAAELVAPGHDVRTLQRRPVRRRRGDRLPGLDHRPAARRAGCRRCGRRRPPRRESLAHRCRASDFRSGQRRGNPVAARRRRARRGHALRPGLVSIRRLCRICPGGRRRRAGRPRRVRAATTRAPRRRASCSRLRGTRPRCRSWRSVRTSSGVPATRSWSSGSSSGPAGDGSRCSTAARPSSTRPTSTTPRPAIAAALDRATEAHGRAYVLTNGEPRPVGDLLAGICLAAGVPPPRWSIPAGLGRAAGSVDRAGLGGSARARTSRR